MDLQILDKIMAGEPAFKLKQAKEAIFKNLIDDWSQATNLPLALRQKLNQECPLLINAEFFESADKNSVRCLLTLKDGLKTETILMRHGDGRNTICVSSQIGCPLGCVFCATGDMGFKRNLDAMEIVEQVLLFARYLKKETDDSPFEKGGLRGILENKSSPTLLSQRGEENRINNVVFMGMGEPFLNYENVLEAIKILNNKEGLSIGARHISISTIGITEGIEKLSDEPLQINLAISLHAPNDELRSRIVPANKKYPIDKIFEAIKEYIKKTGRKLMIEYIMIQRLNDAPAQARELAKLIKKHKITLCFINLISCNPTGIFKPSPRESIKAFKKILENNKIIVTQRYRFGQEIKGACGQLTGKIQ